MDKTITDIHQNLQRQIGLHRQMLETVRMERKALLDSDLKGVQESTLAKEALIQGIQQCESERLKLVGLLATKWKRPAKDLTLTNVIIAIQGDEPRAAELLRSAQNALTVLVQRTIEQNRENRDLVERSLEHVNNMKQNVLHEQAPKNDTYTQKGQKSGPAQGARLISKEI